MKPPDTGSLHEPGRGAQGPSNKAPPCSGERTLHRDAGKIFLASGFPDLIFTG
jgi:hypothetical protein